METYFKRTCVKEEPSYALYYTEGITNKDDISVKFHYDRDFAIMYLKKGRGILRAEGNPYAVSDGDVIIMSPYEIHRYELTDGVYQQRIVLYVNPSVLSGFGADIDEFFSCFNCRMRGIKNVIPSETAKQYKLDVLLEEMLELAKSNQKKSDALCLCKIVEVLSAACDAYEEKTEVHTVVPLQNQTVISIIEYVNANLSSDMSIEKIADEFYLSKSRIEHLFKEKAGVSLWDYIILRRLVKCNEYIKNGETVKEAAYKSGFNNYSNFYRLYKKHIKMTPSEYKARVALD